MTVLLIFKHSQFLRVRALVRVGTLSGMFFLSLLTWLLLPKLVSQGSLLSLPRPGKADSYTTLDVFVTPHSLASYLWVYLMDSSLLLAHEIQASEDCLLSFLLSYPYLAREALSKMEA